MTDYNTADIIHAHVTSEYYRTRLMSDGTDGYFIGSRGDVPGDWPVKATAAEILEESSQSALAFASAFESNEPTPPTCALPITLAAYQYERDPSKVQRTDTKS